MRNLFIFILALVFNILPLYGQSIKINNSYSPEVLVQDVFVNGACKNISKIRSIGNRAGIGFLKGEDQVLDWKRESFFLLEMLKMLKVPTKKEI